MIKTITNVFIWVLVGRLLNSPGKLDYLLIGNAATASLGTFCIVVGTWERFDGTYPLLVAAPHSLAPAVMGRMSVWAISWIPSSLLTFIVLAFTFDFHFAPTEILVIPLLVSLISLTTFFLSAFLGAIIAGTPRLRLIYAWTLLAVLNAFCGINVPVDFWPRSVQIFSHFLPITHGLEAIRRLIDHDPASEILHLAFLELLVGFLWLALALLAFRRTSIADRQKGSIDFA